MEVTGALLDWAAEQGLTWDMSPADDGERWGGRLEIYLTDPSQEPDMSKWETQLAFRLAGEKLGQARVRHARRGVRRRAVHPRRPAPGLRGGLGQRL